MLRVNYRRLGHQLIKEPMGHEENTFSRGVRTKFNALKHVGGVTVFCGAGCVCAVYSFIAAQRRVLMSVNSEGKMVKTTCPWLWWNY